MPRRREQVDLNLNLGLVHLTWTRRQRKQVEFYMALIRTIYNLVALAAIIATMIKVWF